MTKEFKLEWSEFNDCIHASSTAIHVHYYQYETDPNKYLLYLVSASFIFECDLTDPDDVTDFETTHKANAHETESENAAQALGLAHVAGARAMPVEVKTPIGGPNFKTWIICTHNYCDPTTWYQKSEVVTSQVLTATNTSYLEYSGDDENWINPHHPVLYNQSYNMGPAGGYQQDGLWLNNGTRARKEDYAPAIRTDGITQSTGYSIDYTNGTVVFSESLTATTEVDVDYRKATTNEYAIGPTTGKKWEIARIEINTTDALVMTDTMNFQFWADPNRAYTHRVPYLGAEMKYQSILQFQMSAVAGGDVYPAMGGTVTMDPDAVNGYGIGYKRGTDQKVVIMPYTYRKPYILPASDNITIRACTEDLTTPFDGADFCNTTFYVEEDDE